ncbi:MAG: peptidylprolyl isomerase [Bacteroidetes bacterium]|nr:peptidylprolyl isomerase [Bacteroidota bacterium]
MKNITILCYVGFFLLALGGCSPSNPTVATIGDEKYTLREFENDYVKNNGGWEQCEKTTLEERKNFLDLMVNYRLKVKEAYDKGLLNDPELQKEIKLYRSSVAQSYILERELVQPAVQQFYERRKELVRASHVLIRVHPDAQPEDTAQAYERAMNIIAEVPYRSFDSLARQYSQDVSVQRNNGDLGYFTSGRMVGEFEDACYALKAGEYTKVPVRTQYGYHIIKVTDRCPNKGIMGIAHIVLEISEQMDSAKVRDSIWAIYREIKSGLPFDTAAARYSMDYNSKYNGGFVGAYTRDRLATEVGTLLFNTPVDSVTEPVGFHYGYHIFKVKSLKPLPPFSELEKDLRTTYQQTRYQSDHKRLVDKLNREYNVRIVDSVLEKLSVAFDTTKTPAEKNWRDTVDVELLRAILIQTRANNYTVDDVLEKINNNQEMSGTQLTKTNVEKLVKKIAETAGLEQYALSRIPAYPELEKLLREYQDGIVLYRIEQEKIWNAITVNDSVLREFYEPRKEKYRWPDRVNFAEIYVLSDSLAKALYQRIKKGEDFLALAEKMTVRAGYKEKQGVWGFQAYTVNPLYERASKMAVDSVSEPFRYQAGWSIIKTLAFDSARVKTFEEATPELIGAYQDYMAEKLKQAWVQELRQKYQVKENMDVLREAFTRKRAQ